MSKKQIQVRLQNAVFDLMADGNILLTMYWYDGQNRISRSEIISSMFLKSSLGDDFSDLIELLGSAIKIQRSTEQPSTEEPPME